MTKEALEGSIKKWQDIVDCKTDDRGAENCPLCHVFDNLQNLGCKGCPVSERTGQPHCLGTPYEEWAALFRYRAGLRMVVGSNPSRERTLAQEELDFLISLRS
jgi:hypothetical protein